MAPVDVCWPQIFPDSLNINKVKSAKTHGQVKHFCDAVQLGK